MMTHRSTYLAIGAALAVTLGPLPAVAQKVGGVFSDPIVQRPQFRIGTTQPFSAPTLEERSAARPAMVATDQFGTTFTTSDQPNPYATAAAGPLILARSGDLIYASLIYGFDNTDVQGLPIYATIHDYLPNGTRGPLDGARVRGQVQYSREDASVVFDQATLANGLEIPIDAVAVSDTDGRTGVASNVNRHTVSRYGSLFLAGLIQGYGEVAQIRLQDSNQDSPTTVVNTGGGAVTINRTGREEPSDGEIVAGAIRPIGDNLSGVAAENFNRPFTITGSAGMGFSLVFLSTIVTDPSDISGRAFNPRTGQYEAVTRENDIPDGGPGNQQGVPVPQAIQDAVRRP